MISQLVPFDREKDLEELAEKEFEIKVPTEIKEKFQPRKQKYKERNLVHYSILNVLNLPPSAIEETVSKGVDNYIRYIKIKSKCLVIPLKKLIDSLKYDGEMVLTSGKIMGQGILYEPRVDIDPPFVLEDKNGIIISCSYNDYRFEGGFRFNSDIRPTVFKETIYGNRGGVVRRTNPDELYAFLEAHKKKGTPIIVGGKVSKDRLIADIFIMDKTHLFGYFLK